MDSLQKIIEYKRLELEHNRRQVPQREYVLMCQDNEPPRDFLKNFHPDEINIIAEIKKASPSAGVIREDFNPVAIAKIYEDNGAKAISLLTDEHFFQGHLKYLKQVKEQVQLPTLRKDFMLDEYHVFEGRAHGADAILLIVAALDDFQIKDYRHLSEELGMTVLVEVHDQNELDRILNLNIHLLGINNRNLKTLKTDYKVSLELLKNNNLEAVTISESGLDHHDLLLKLRDAGIQGFLIGEALMRSKDIGQKLREFIHGGGGGDGCRR